MNDKFISADDWRRAHGYPIRGEMWNGWPDETHSFEIPPYRCGGYGILNTMRIGLLAVAIGAAWIVLGKEISKKGLTSLGEVVMLPIRRTILS